MENQNKPSLGAGKVEQQVMKLQESIQSATQRAQAGENREQELKVSFYLDFFAF